MQSKWLFPIKREWNSLIVSKSKPVFFSSLLSFFFLQQSEKKQPPMLFCCSIVKNISAYRKLAKCKTNSIKELDKKKSNDQNMQQFIRKALIINYLTSAFCCCCGILVALRRNTSKSDNNFSIIWDFRFGLSFSRLSHTTFIFRLTLSLVEQHDGNNKTHPRKYTNIRINQRKWQKPSRMKIGCDALLWSALSRCARCTVYACIFHYWAYAMCFDDPTARPISDCIYHQFWANNI